MCIGLPMQVLVVEPGHARCIGRDGERRVRTDLIGPVVPGDWLLVHLDSARERLTSTRAAEIEAVLALVESALGGGEDSGEPLFALPSATTAASLCALTGQAGGAAEGKPHEKQHEKQDGKRPMREASR